MKSHCLPFSQIPHTTKLFQDFLSHSPEVQQFYPHSPRFSEWFQERAANLNYDSARRKQVCEVLERQNTFWNASPKTMANIARLRAGAGAVVTGQQVGLFGGPLFSLFKALSAVKLAQVATEAGVDCVPIFWLATEDHDLDEINHVSLIASDGSLNTVTASSSAAANAPVGTIKFGTEIEDAVEKIAQLLGDSEISTAIREAYRPGETFGTAFAKLFSRLFSDWGVILLDASDAEFHRISEPIYVAAARQSRELNEALLSRGKELEHAGYHQQVKVTSSSTLLFNIRNGARLPVHRHTSATGELVEFVIGEEKVSEHDLLSAISASPETFSPNVLLRPVIQDFLLPTLAYAGGAAEIAYFAQVGEVYRILLGTITPVVPRFSATAIDTKQQLLLERHGLRLQDFFKGPEAIRETVAAGTLPQALSKSMDAAEASLHKSMSEVSEALGALDKTLIQSAATAESKMMHQLASLRSRAARAELRTSEVLERHAELLNNSLYPKKSLQEREIAGVYFLARHGFEFLHELAATLHPDCLDHQIISI